MPQQSRADYLAGAQTHEVFNVAEPFENYNSYREDLHLQHLVRSFGAGWADSDLSAWGEKTGSARWLKWGFLANANPPKLCTHDAYGRRLDAVEYHPAYHNLMRGALGRGLHSIPWNQPGAGAHVYRAALVYLQTQVEQGHGCPVTMTFSCVPTLRRQADLAEQWLPKVLATDYDPSDRPMEEKKALTIGMAMTEKQGGSDLRANTTIARPLYAHGGGQPYELLGHKFFMSAPMSDAFLFLAQTEGNLSCFLVPRWRPDGERNTLFIQRLKDKMGNVSNASSEVELRGTLGWLVGEEGRGVATILEMGALTRFDCLLASAAAMRQAVVQAVHHCTQRRAFGKALVDQPLMQNVLADLIVESDAALVLAMRLAKALDHPDNPGERALLRIGTAIGKYWNCKRVPGHAYEAMECLGGNGVMNDFMTARLYREAPINAIWEGSGNIQCLDVLRVLERQPECLQALQAELMGTQGLDPRLDAHVDKLYQRLGDQNGLAYTARTLVEAMALALQGSLLLSHGDARVADAFLASRLDAPAGLYGNLPPGIPVSELIERAIPLYG